MAVTTPSSRFQSGAVSEQRYMTMCSWEESPHLDPVEMAGILASTPPHLRDARSKGIPGGGEGQIYITPLEDILVDPFPIPEHWPRAYGLDVGWNKTACIWAAIDRDTDTVYLNAEYYVGEKSPVVHATAIKARGEWIPGVVDPAANKTYDRHDGEKLMAEYQSLGLDIKPADNSVEAGIMTVSNMLDAGKLKLFSTCQHFQNEYRFYRRVVRKNELGVERAIVLKTNDHLCDALRYLIMSGLKRAVTRPQPRRVSPHGRGDPTVGY